MPRKSLAVIVLVLLACAGWGLLSRPAAPPASSGDWWTEFRRGCEARDQRQLQLAEGHFENSVPLAREPAQRVASLEALADILERQGQPGAAQREEARRVRHTHGI